MPLNWNFKKSQDFTYSDRSSTEKLTAHSIFIGKKTSETIAVQVKN